jgi:nicotinamidase/pyrazinamidase
MTPSQIRPAPTDALLVVDLQVDFLPAGRLGVPGGDEVIPLANRLARAFPLVVLTQDWHPPDHLSFAAGHPGRAPFEIVDMPYGGQILWPEHCVWGSPGAAFAPGLDIPQAGLVLRKGWNRAVDSYSAFNEADGTPTGLAGYLAQRGVSRVFLLGLATDFCVAWSALDAVREGFAVAVIEDACRAIDLAGSCAAAWERMAAAGVGRLESGAIAVPSGA